MWFEVSRCVTLNGAMTTVERMLGKALALVVADNVELVSSILNGVLSFLDHDRGLSGVARDSSR